MVNPTFKNNKTKKEVVRAMHCGVASKNSESKLETQKSNTSSESSKFESSKIVLEATC